MRTLLAGILVLFVLGPAAADDLVRPVEPEAWTPDTTGSWGIGLAYGGQWYGEGLDAGTAGALQISYGALVETDREGRWLFELGYEYAQSDRRPAVDDDDRRSRLRAHGLFYRFNRFIGQRFYLGGRVGMSRVRGTADKNNLDLVVGLQTGVRLGGRVDAGIELITYDPETSGPAAFPADTRGILTVRF
ncbi:MAG: hypothetical protein JJT90_16730 [Ectothiorhodospiraceae bacterium]|nr:hypothetical protein [Ectothiorhodospiraceae bacterium]